MALPSLERRLHASLRRIGAWPESAPAVTGRPGPRTVPPIRSPSRPFHRITTARVGIPHAHHTARLAP